MNIAQVCPRYKPFIGGIETHVEEISKRLVKRGWNIEVITGDPTWKLKRNEILDGVKVTRFPSISISNSYHFIPGMVNYINKGNYDLIHIHGYHALPSLQVALLCKKKRLVFTPHYKGFSHSAIRSLLHKIYRPIGRKIFLKADMIICVSSYEKKKIINDFKIPENKICLIPNGIDWEKIKENQTQIKPKAKNHKTILCVSRLESYKGIQYLIEVLPKLPPNIHLKVIGTGPFKKKLIKLVKKLGVKDRVYFIHNLPRKELLREYIAADLFVLLSKYEAYGLTVAEALASGTPCIVANTTALKEWIDNKNCFGVEYPIDIEELINIVNEVMGRKVSANKLPSWDESVKKLIAIYETLSRQ